jgi:beta-1,4-mannosyltransferase
MQYHALALARAGVEVDLIGYAGTELPRDLQESPRIRCHLLAPSRPAPRRPRVLFLGVAALRVFRQCGQLLRVLLFRIARPDVVLVQSPPAIPTLLLAPFVRWARGAKLLIDWHNFGYSMLALTVGQNHTLVRAARWYEGATGRLADAHLCVSRAMRDALATGWGIEATVLYDRPAARFRPQPPDARRSLLHRIAREIAALAAPQRPALVVSPSGWTADEDFELLLDAAVRCDRLLAEHTAEPARHVPLLILLTGMGPLRATYEERMQRLPLRVVQLRTLWLSPGDYPLLLAAADLGLCLHRSASGVDLPMKVADMLGAGLPVCALDYGPCLAEQVHHDQNGLLFSSAAELAGLLFELFRNFPNETPELDRLRGHVMRERQTWEEGWRQDVLPVLSRLWRAE